MKPFILFIIALVLFLGCQNTVMKEKTISINSGLPNEGMEEQYIALEQQLTLAQASGGINSQSYKEIDRQIAELETEGLSQEKVGKLRALLSKLEIGGSKQKQSQPDTNEVQLVTENISQAVKNIEQTPVPVQCERHMGFDNYRTFSSFAVDPSDSKTIYEAVEYKGVFKSVDGGNTWIQKSKGIKGYPSSLNPKEICHNQHPALLIDSKNSKRLLLTTATSPGTLEDIHSENGGLYQSLDGGETWRQVFEKWMNGWTYEAITVDPTDANIIYVGTTAMPASHGGADPDKIFVTKGILYKSVDGGSAWKELPTGFKKDLRAGKVFVDSKNPKNVVFFTFGLAANRGAGEISAEQLGVLLSEDGGETWKMLTSLPEKSRAIRASDASTRNFNNFFLVDSNGLTYYTTDRGNTFNLVQLNANLVRYDRNDETGMRLLGINVYKQPDSLFESLDGGATWTTIGKLPAMSEDDRPSNIVFDPSDKNIIYLNGDMAKVWKSTDKGNSWTLISSMEKLGK